MFYQSSLLSFRLVDFGEVKRGLQCSNIKLNHNFKNRKNITDNLGLYKSSSTLQSQC